MNYDLEIFTMAHILGSIKSQCNTLEIPSKNIENTALILFLNQFISNKTFFKPFLKRGDLFYTDPILFQVIMALTKGNTDIFYNVMTNQFCGTEILHEDSDYLMPIISLLNTKEAFKIKKHIEELGVNKDKINKSFDIMANHIAFIIDAQIVRYNVKTGDIFDYHQLIT